MKRAVLAAAAVLLFGALVYLALTAKPREPGTAAEPGDPSPSARAEGDDQRPPDRRAPPEPAPENQHLPTAAPPLFRPALPSLPRATPTPFPNPPARRSE